MNFSQPGSLISLGSLGNLPWLAVLLTLLALSGCNPWNWRELRAADSSWSAALPDKPQTETRAIDFSGTPIRLTMHSTGFGATLFAIGEATLPAALAADPIAHGRLIDWLSERLLANVGASQVTTSSSGLALPPGRQLRAARALTAQAALGSRHGKIAARWFIVDDRLYQLVAMGADDELPAAAVDNFFLSFRLLPR